MTSPIRPKPVDLNQLYREDPAAAEVGFALNEPRHGGVSLDRNNQVLTFDEFVKGRARLAPQLTAPQVQQALARLATRFSGGDTTWSNGPLLGPTDLRPIELPSLGLDLMATTHVHDGKTTTVAETYDPTFTRGQLVAATGGAKAEPLFPGLAPLLGAPSFGTAKGATALYFAGGERIDGPVTFFRAPLTAEGLGAPQRLASPDGLDSLMSWPKVFETPRGLGVVYRDRNSQLHLATSADGSTWRRAAVALPAGAMHDVALAKDGTWALTFQQGAGGQMTAFISLSPDGARFGSPVPLSSTSGNVHDATLVPRPDGGLDAYYISATSTAGFSLFRRFVATDGTLGPEQQLTDAAQSGEVSKPSVTRLANGQLSVTVAAITARAPNGEPSRQQLFSATVPSDAPRQ